LRRAFYCLLFDLNNGINIVDNLSIIDRTITSSFGGGNQFNVSYNGFKRLGECNEKGTIIISDISIIQENAKKFNRNGNLAFGESISRMFDALINYDKPNATVGGSKKQTKERIMLGGKSRVIYVGKRGGKYVKQNGKFVSIKKL